MSAERNKEYKPLSFSTTMRNPLRIASFLNCILPYEGQILNNEIIDKIAISLISKKLYVPMIVNRIPKYKNAFDLDADLTVEMAKEIKDKSPQQHKEAGFDKGWPSRFDTWYKLPMEFGFVFYEMNKPVVISTTGHMLVDAFNENPVNDEKIKKIFLNALMKYQTDNPFRKNANDNVPLPLLLRVIKLLKDDAEETDAGIFRNELSLIICWPNNDAKALYNMIKKLRKAYGFSYSDEIIYDICLKLLGADESQKNRFKIDQITGEAVDEFIRKMRITGIVSLRGNGRFLDFNTFEIDAIHYILDNYSEYNKFDSKDAYFAYMGTIDNNILSIRTAVNVDELGAIRTKVLNEWASTYSKEEIMEELLITCGKSESHNVVLRLIDKPTRFEFLTSIALKQNFDGLVVCPNYHIDDEGLPTFTASGGLADIECFDIDCNPLVEVTLMVSRNQATNEMPAITRHLQEATTKYPDKLVFSILVAPAIHADTKYMAEFSKYQYHVDILTYTINEFLQNISETKKIIELNQRQT